jgi:hypothetical protein
MTDLALRLLGFGLPLFALAGCAQNSAMTGTIPLDDHGTSFSRLNPGPNAVTFTAFAQGRLVFEANCFRMVTRQASMAIVWPETAVLVHYGKGTRIEDHAARWSASVGDRIRLGGAASDDISSVDLNNAAVRSCPGPYFVASNVIRHRFLF